MNKLKYFNIFIFLETLSKLMIELFIPILLYKNGYSFNYILIFFIIKFIIILLTIIPISKLGQKVSFKALIIISNIFLCITTFLLKNILVNNYYLTLIAILNGLYIILYWIGRHVYVFNIITDKKTTETVSSITIVSLLASVPSSFIGALIIDKLGYNFLIILVLILSSISILPLFKIKETKGKLKINILKEIKIFPIKNYFFTFFYQIYLVCLSILPLYIYIYIKNNLEYIGIINVISNISSIIYIYIIAKIMDKNKKDYLTLTAFILGIIWILKIGIKGPNLFLFIMFFSGVLSSCLDMIISRDIYSLGNNSNIISYIIFYEIINTFFKLIFVIILLLFNIKIKMTLLISVICLFTLGIIKYNDGKKGY